MLVHFDIIYGQGKLSQRERMTTSKARFMTPPWLANYIGLVKWIKNMKNSKMTNLHYRKVLKSWLRSALTAVAHFKYARNGAKGRKSRESYSTAAMLHASSDAF